MNDPLVSVIVICHNESEWVAPALRSVLDQSYRHLQVLLIDDGSTDDTVAIARQLAEPRLQIVCQPNAGACNARNHGLRLARGALVQFLDGDDLLHVDKIERQVEAWRSDGDDHVYFGPFGRFLRHADHARFHPGKNWRDMDGHAWLVACWTDGGMMAPHAWLTPMPIIQRAGLWDESLQQNQDGDYFSKVLLASKGVRFCAEARCYYRVAVRSSISARSDEVARKSRLRGTRQMVERLLAVDDRPEVRRACGNAYEEQMFINYPALSALAAESARLLAAVGGSDHSQPFRGPTFKIVSRLIGWKAARHLQYWWQRCVNRMSWLLEVKRIYQP